jgi:uncharacterized protein (TIGR00252 family)
MTNYSSGHSAEQIAAEYLKRQGYTVLQTNWKTRYCEIDVIAKKQSCIYFVEVKSRKTSDQGTGFDYVTPQKIRKMTFAAELWNAHNNWQGDYELSALEVSGESFVVSNFVPNLSL